MKKGNSGESDFKGLSGSFRAGTIALVFLVIGYQVSLFVHKAAVAKVAAAADAPDTVYVLDPALAERLLSEENGVPVHRRQGDSAVRSGGTHAHAVRSDGKPRLVYRHNAGHSAAVNEIRGRLPQRQVESFRFNPNTVSEGDLMRLGFSPGQAASIIAYREKGGRFRRKSDFAKSYVVEDSVYKRLEPYIDIPKIDLNRADSAALDALPGIGGYFANQIIRHRSELGGYTCREQLLDIYRFDREKFDGLKDLITVGPGVPPPFGLWSLPADSLRLHPYVRSWQCAKSIVFYREHNPREAWTIEGLADAGVITADQSVRLKRLKIAAP